MDLEELKRLAQSQAIRDFGLTLFDNGNYIEALLAFEESLTFNSDDIISQQYRGMCKCLLAVENQADIQDAISDFKRVLQQHEDSSQQARQVIKNLSQKE